MAGKQRELDNAKNEIDALRRAQKTSDRDMDKFRSQLDQVIKLSYSSIK